MIDKLDESKIKEECVSAIFKLVDETAQNLESEEECMLKFFRILDILRELSVLIRKLDNNVIWSDALADILFLYSKTYTYFTDWSVQTSRSRFGTKDKSDLDSGYEGSYEGFKGIEIGIRK